MRIYVGNDNLITVEGLRDTSSGGTYINDAVVSAQLREEGGANIGTAIAMTYVAASEGRYEGIVPDDAAFVAHGRYEVVITVNVAVGGARLGQWTLPVTGAVRAS